QPRPLRHPLQIRPQLLASRNPESSPPLEHPVLRHRLPKKRRAARALLTAPARHQARSPSALKPSALKPSALKPSALKPSPLPGPAAPRRASSRPAPALPASALANDATTHCCPVAEPGSRRALRPVLRGGVRARNADLCALERCDHGLLHDGGGAWLSPRPPA